MNVKNTKIILAEHIVVLMFLIALFVFGIYDIRAKNKETSELLGEVDSITTARSNAREVEQILKSATTSIREFEGLILTSDKLVNLIEKIEKTGRDLGLETAIVSVGGADEGGSKKTEKIRIVLETKGSWTANFTFLSAIESLPYRVIINESSFLKEEGSQSGDIPKWRQKIILELYSFE